MIKVKHNRKGNCWYKAYYCKECGKDNLCDICHEHDSPKGDCEDCPICEACKNDEIK